ncbi:hypothetical protein BH10PSE12_BH10PSE12_23010 [soil metagenome]
MTSGNRPRSVTTGWILLGLFAISTGIATVFPSAALAGNIVVLAFCLVHGAQRYGWRAILAALAIIFIIAMVLENISIVTGFPFGHFRHSEVMGPKLLHVPYAVPLFYFTLSYPAWAVANLLLNEADRDGKPLSTIGLPLVAMFIPSAIDGTLDPIAATLNHSWTWPSGGGYFGVPLSNFLGIMAVHAIAFFAFALILTRNSGLVRAGQSPGWWAQPAVLMLIFSIVPAIAMAVQPDRTAIDPAGVAWRARDIYEGLTVFSLLGPFLLGLTALLVALRGR